MISLEELGLPRNEQYQRFARTLNAILEQVQCKGHATHVLVFGSFVRGELTEYADLDILIVEKELPRIAHDVHKIDSVLVEIVRYTREQLTRLLTDEVHSFIRRSASMLASARVVYGDASLRPLLLRAKRIHHSLPPRLTAKQLCEYRKFFQRQREIMIGYLQRNDALNFHLRINVAIGELVTRYFHVVRQRVPQYKHMNAEITDTIFKHALYGTIASAHIATQYRNFCVMTKRLERLANKNLL